MVIAICGYKQSGKDTVADCLIHNNGFVKYSFATPIKLACKHIFNWTEEHINGRLKDVVDPVWGISPRLALQLLGTEFAQYLLCEKSPDFARITGRSLWVKRFTDMVLQNDYNHYNMKWVVPDLRFPHEVEELKKVEAIIIRVDRPEVVPVGELHESESHVMEIKADFVIENTSTLLDLNKEIKRVVSFIMKKYS